MVNVLLAASPATRSRPRAIKGQEPGLVDVLLQPTEQTRSRRKAEVVNELLWVAGPKERSPALAPGPLSLNHGRTAFSLLQQPIVLLLNRVRSS